MSKEYLKAHWRLLSVFALCIGVLLLSLAGWAPADGDYSKGSYLITTFTLGILAGSLLIVLYETEKVREKLDRLLSFQPDEQLLQLSHKYGRPISPTEVEQVWYEFCVAMKQSYRATNYADLTSMYSTRLAQAAIAIQKAKIEAQSFTITKIFVVDSSAEANCSRAIREQRRTRIDARFVLRSAIGNVNDKAMSVDFGIFDDQVVLVWKLKNRKIVGGEVLDIRRNKSMVQKYRDLFAEIMNKSSSVEVYDTPDTAIRQIIADEASPIVASWPKYRPPFENFNYALDLNKGWLATYAKNSSSITYGLYRNEKLLGYTILNAESDLREFGDFEFYIAVHPNETGAGLAQTLTSYTIYEMRKANRGSIFLRVRIDHPAAGFYQRFGFQYLLRGGNKLVITSTVAGKDVQFHVMELSRRGK